jgi:hypothetical protein
MAQLKGSVIVVSASVDGSTWHPVGEMNSFDLGIGAAALDITKFGDQDIERIQGLRDTPWSIGGFYDPTDTTGQVVILNALLNATALYFKAIVNPTGSAGTQGFSQQVVPTKFEIKGDPATVQTVTVTADSTGAITSV